MLKDTLRRYFIPSEHNNYAPHILQKTAMSVMLFLVLLTFAVSNIQSIVMVSSQWFVSTILPAVLVDLTNENREEGRLDMLERSPVLDRAAQLKAEDMARGSYFAHNSPEGITPWHWFKQVGYTYAYAGENLAVHFTDSKEVVDAWMESPGHRANILDEHYTEIGIGTAKGEYKGHPTVFVVQLFGTPAQVAAAPAPAPAPDPQPAATEAPSEEGEVVLDSVEEPPVTEVALADDTIDVQGVQDSEGAGAEASSTEPSSATTTDDFATSTEPLAVADEAFTPTASILKIEIATTSGLVPLATAGMTVGQRNGDAKFSNTVSNTLGRLSTQPNKVLSAIYSILAMFVIVVLAISIAIEWRHQHPVQIAYGTGLLALMAVMWYVQEALVSGALIT